MGGERIGATRQSIGVLNETLHEIVPNGDSVEEQPHASEPSMIILVDHTSSNEILRFVGARYGLCLVDELLFPEEVEGLRIDFHGWRARAMSHVSEDSSEYATLERLNLGQLIHVASGQVALWSMVLSKAEIDSGEERDALSKVVFWLRLGKIAKRAWEEEKKNQ